MEPTYYKLIKFSSADTKNGVLTMFQHAGGHEKDNMPFPIKKALYMRGMKGKDVRGGHTHHKTQQILFALTGSCTVNLENGKETCQIRLDSPDTGLVLYPYVWHTMQDFAENTTLLVLADMEYDERDYIRSYDDFKNFLAEKKPW